ncbi:IPTL-CTERM sorting domain-containing protein [Allofranklinella schreckenbergeri]|uniref:IPTL-CTERM sorting domain-containing protein n=2 Tax=Allofranklinella schreckenbergeri TaxID=1076744 RepID=A0A3M6R7Y6_9BURK|nr:IPTL-CTERM sorting domain-containing protein [Allofranklinella schreckenbergeri]
MQAVALAAGLLCATGAAQAKTWILSSDKEGLSSYNTGISIVNSIYSTFETAAGGPTETIDGRGLLHASATDPLPADVPADVDIVVVATVQPNQTVTGVQHGVDATRFAKVMDWAKTRSDLTFVFLNDGCCRPSDTGSVAGFLNNSLGLSGADEITRVGSVAPQGNSVYLNTNSPYKDNFAALDPLTVEVYGKYVNVPAPYAVYLAPAAADTPPASMPAAADKVQAYGIVVPRAATNGSACVIAFSDTSQFALASAPAQAGQLANSIMAAAKDSAGACQVKTVATADLVPSITLSSPLQVGGSGTLTVKVDNHGQSDSAAGGKVVVTLPAQAQVDDTALPTGCTKPAPSEVECTLGAITAQNHKTFALPITIVGSGADSTFKAQVIGGSADTGELAPQLQNNGPIDSKVTIAAPTATITGPASAQPNAATTVTGTATGLADGTVINVTVDGTSVQATVNGGQFSANFPNGFPVGQYPVTITGPGGQNLPLTAPHSIEVKAAPATATISGPATATAGTGFTVTGASNASDGTVIQVTVGGHTVPATVNGGQFSANIPGLAAGNYPVTITGATLTAPHTINVTAAPTAPSNAAPVPALNVWGLGALAALLGAAGLRRQRKRQR